jgi:hypothetical protein
MAACFCELFNIPHGNMNFLGSCIWSLSDPCIPVSVVPCYDWHNHYFLLLLHSHSPHLLLLPFISWQHWPCPYAESPVHIHHFLAIPRHYLHKCFTQYKESWICWFLWQKNLANCLLLDLEDVSSMIKLALLDSWKAMTMICQVLKTDL